MLARAEWQDPAFAEGLMRDMSGRVIEGVFSNLFLITEGHLRTASLSRCGVSGVMRAEIMARAAGLALPVNECDISYSELLQADEVFVCNSLYGIWPVTGLAERVWSVGPLTRKLQTVVADLLSDS